MKESYSNLKGQPAFPLKQDFVVFEPNLSLISKEESAKFGKRINQITGVAPEVAEGQNPAKPKIAHYSHKQSLLHVDKSTIHETQQLVRQYRLEHNDKVV